MLKLFNKNGTYLQPVHNGDGKLQQYLTELIELEDSLVVASQDRIKLHLRYASILADIPLFELSISLDLLDNLILEKLSPYLHSLKFLIDTSKITLHEEISDDNLEERFILEGDIEAVSKILGLDKISDSTHHRQTFTKVIDTHQKIMTRVKNLLIEGKETDVYFGTKYYPKLQAINYAFSIDTEESAVYLLLYGVDEDIPIIYRKKPVPEIITEAIRLTCISSTELDFYTTY